MSLNLSHEYCYKQIVNMHCKNYFFSNKGGKQVLNYAYGEIHTSTESVHFWK